MRIEKQIYAGRQDIRRALKGKNKSAEPPSLLLPPQSTHLTHKLQSSNPSHSSERPLSVDTDAEAAFSNGSRWFYRRGRQTPPSQPMPSPGPGACDPLLSSSIRRKWATGLLDIPSNSQEGEQAGQGDHTEDHENSSTTRPVRPSSSHGSFFSRLRQNSVPSLSLSFTQARNPASSDDSPDGGSSLSSSSDEEPTWPHDYVHHSVLRGRRSGQASLVQTDSSDSEDI